MAKPGQTPAMGAKSSQVVWPLWSHCQSWSPPSPTACRIAVDTSSMRYSLESSDLQEIPPHLWHDCCTRLQPIHVSVCPLRLDSAANEATLRRLQVRNGQWASWISITPWVFDQMIVAGAHGFISKPHLKLVPSLFLLVGVAHTMLCCADVSCFPGRFVARSLEPPCSRTLGCMEQKMCLCVVLSRLKPPQWRIAIETGMPTQGSNKVNLLTNCWFMLCAVHSRLQSPFQTPAVSHVCFTFSQSYKALLWWCCWRITLLTQCLLLTGAREMFSSLISTSPNLPWVLTMTLSSQVLKPQMFFLQVTIAQLWRVPMQTRNTPPPCLCETRTFLLHKPINSTNAGYNNTVRDVSLAGMVRYTLCLSCKKSFLGQRQPSLRIEQRAKLPVRIKRGVPVGRSDVLRAVVLGESSRFGTVSHFHFRSLTGAYAQKSIIVLCSPQTSHGHGFHICWCFVICTQAHPIL